MTKKKFLKFLPLIILGVAGLGVGIFFIIRASIGSDSPKEIEYSTVWSADDEYHWHRAIDTSITEVKDKAPHTYSEWIIAKEATEDSDGYKTRTCSICGHVMTEIIPFTSPFDLKLEDNNTYTILSVKDTEKTRETLSIPTKINEIPVTTISEKAFDGCTNLKTLNMGSNVKNVGSDAFKDLSFTKFNYLGDMASWCNISFENEYSNPVSITKSIYLNDVLQTSINLPKSVSKIGKYVFYGFDNLVNVNYGGLLQDWLKIEFSHEYSNPLRCNANLTINNIKLTKITIPDGVEKINDYSFIGSTIESITLPESVTIIGDYAFYDNKELTEIVFNTNPDLGSLGKIGKYAFAKCTSLSIITTPPSLEVIDEYAFYGDIKLFNLNLNTNLKAINKGAFKDNIILESFNAPEGLEVIGDEAFSGCIKLKDLTFNENLVSIGNYAFSGAKDLISLSLPTSIENLGSYAFYNCSSISRIILINLDKLTVIKDHTFEGCTNATELSLGENTVEIEDYAFKGCSSISELLIPDNVTKIGKYAFSECTSLVKVTLGKNLELIDDYAFYLDVRLIEIFNNSNLELVIKSITHGYVAYYALIIHNSAEESIITKIDNYLLISINGVNYVLEVLNIPSVLSIPEKLFLNDTEYIIEGIYTSAFEGVTTLKEITLPDSIKVIKEKAFKDCSNLNIVNLSNNLTTIENKAFEGASMLISLTLPASITEIGIDAFNDCFRLVEIYNLSALDIEKESDANGKVGKYAFIIHNDINDKPLVVKEGFYYFLYNEEKPSYLLGYTGDDLNIVIPSMFTYDNVVISNLAIYDKAFYKANLNVVLISDNYIIIGNSAFEGSKITEVTIPKTIYRIKDSAFKDCINLLTVNYGDAEETFRLIVIEDNNEPLLNANFNYNSPTEQFEEAWTYDDLYHWHKSTNPYSTNVSGKELHDVDWIEDENPDLDGIYHQHGTCKVCGAELEIVHEHTFDIEYTDLGNGEHAQKATCSHTNLLINEGPHVYGEWVTIIEATIDDDGLERHTCIYCGHYEDRDIPPLYHEHTYSDSWSYDSTYHWHALSCVHKYPLDLRKDQEPHTFEHYIEESPDINGVYWECERCIECGYKTNFVKHEHITDRTDLYAHDKDYHWNNAVCTQEGGDTLIHTTARVNEQPHNWGIWHLTDDVYDEDGIHLMKWRECLTCGEIQWRRIDEETDGKDETPAS